MRETLRPATPSFSASGGSPPGAAGVDTVAGLKRLAGALVVLAVVFAIPLYRLGRFAADSDLYSHILLIPAITAYLVWIRRRSAVGSAARLPWLAAVPFLAGAAVLVGFGLGPLSQSSVAEENWLAAMIGAFLLCVFAASTLLLGRGTLRTLVFPLAFLAFMIPFPTAVRDGIDTFFQHGSAMVAGWFFSVVGTPVLRDELVFRFSDISIRVAPECSGIHSTLVLVITSLLAGHLFLRSGLSRTILALAVIPLALARNGLRIYVIGQLCESFGPQMINSYIHRHGGPYFFAASLVPLFVLLWWFARSERRSGSQPVHSSAPETAESELVN